MNGILKFIGKWLAFILPRLRRLLFNKQIKELEEVIGGKI